MKALSSLDVAFSKSLKDSQRRTKAGAARAFEYVAVFVFDINAHDSADD